MSRYLDDTEKPRLHLMVGLPRSGKSTYCEFYKGKIPIVSADRTRLLVYGEKFWDAGEELMWAIHRNVVLRGLLEQGLDIVVDETNTTIARRKRIISLAKKYGYEIEAVVFDTPVEVCVERATGNIPLLGAIQRMSEQWEPVTHSEGIDNIKIIINGGVING